MYDGVGEPATVNVPREDALTAWHEAGHAVAYLLHGRVLRYVTLRPRTRGLSGYTSVRPRRVDIATVAVIAHAGPLAQARYAIEFHGPAGLTGEGWTPEDIVLGAYLHGGHDDWDAITTARRAYGLATTRSDRWARIAQHLVDEHWTAIETIAAALLVHRTLPGAQVGHYLEQARSSEMF